LEQDDYEIKVFEISNEFSLKMSDKNNDVMTITNLTLDTSIVALAEKIKA